MGDRVVRSSEIRWSARAAYDYSGCTAAVLVAARAARVPNAAPLIEGLRTWIVRAGEIGLPFLTLGIVLGSFWAQVAWGDYWSWDPKETWALVTWLLVMGWWHLWRSGRRGVLPAALLIVACAALYFTYLGVGVLPTSRMSLHVYTDR